MYLHPIIKGNLLTLLRAGAFGIKDKDIEPMSTFKWNRLEEIAIRLGIGGYVRRGCELYNAGVDHDANHEVNVNVNVIPDGILADETEENYSASGAVMFNTYKEKRLERIVETEPHDMSSSMETLYLLKLIISISNDIVTSTLPLGGIITLGRYLRNDGDKVDYVKLEGWLRKLGVVGMATFQASLLMELFDFERDELPYIHRRYRNAGKHYRHLIDNSLEGKLEFSSKSRLNLAMIETISYKLGNFTTRITNIEE